MKSTTSTGVLLTFLSLRAGAWCTSGFRPGFCSIMAHRAAFFPHLAKFRGDFFEFIKTHALGLKVWPRHTVLDNEFAFAMLFYIWA